MANLSVILQADTAGFNAAMDKAKALVDQFSKTIDSHKDVTSGQVQAYNRVVNALTKVTDGTRTAQQQEKILTQNIKELKIQFANLSEEAKTGDFGKSISNSIKTANSQLAQLRTQMQQASSATKNFGKENSTASEASNGLSNALSLNLLRLGKIGVVLMAAKQAFGPLISAMEENETAADNLAEAWSAAESAFTAFKISLTTADFSNLLRNLNEIIKTGREAARSLDTLETNTGIRNNMLADLRADDAEDKVIIRDKKSTPEQKKAAQNRIEARKPKLAQAAKNQSEENKNHALDLIGARLAQGGITEMTVGRKKFAQLKKNIYDDFKIENKKLGKISYSYNQSVGDPMLSTSTIQKMTKTVNLDDLFGDKVRGKINPFIQAASHSREQAANYMLTMNRYSQRDIETNTNTTRTNTRVEQQKRGLAKLEDDLYKLEQKKANMPIEADFTEINKQIEEKKKEIHAAKVKMGIIVEKTGLEKLEQELSDLEHKRATMDVNADFTEINKQIEDKKKEIEQVEIKMGIKEDPKTTMLNKFSSSLSELYNSKRDTDTVESYNSLDFLEEKDEMTQNKDRLRQIDAEKNANAALISSIYELLDLYKELEGTAPFKLALEFANDLDKEMEDLNKEVGVIVTRCLELNDAQKRQEKAGENIETWQSSLTGLGSTFSSVGDAVGGTTGEILNMTSTVLSSVAQMIPQIISLTAAEGSEALAAVTASGAKQPFPANLIAIAAGVAAVVSALSTTFADGGIFGGAGTVGDLNIARVNKGEMILNGTQQSRLFNLLNGQGGYSDVMAGGNDVKFIIKGKNLEGVRTNYYKRQSRL